MKTITGKLVVVAKTAGLKLNIDGADTNWINPTKAAKDNIISSLDKINKWKNEQVEVTIEDDNSYSAIIIKPHGNDAEEDDMSDEEIAKQHDAVMNESANFQTAVQHEAKKQLTEVAKTIKKEPVTNLEGIKMESQKKESEKKPFEFTGTLTFEPRQSWNQEYFNKLYKDSDMETKILKKGGRDLTYISWATAWARLKELYPDAMFQVHEATTGMPYFHDQTGGFVKVSVSVAGITHTSHLPILDNRNQPVKPTEINTFMINTSVQRCLCKCIAYHGLGLKLYQGEDLKEEP